jgi:hypothetical protein
MYKYETHLHTSPVSKCARASVKDVLEFYKSLGYEGIFLTNHFLDGNINVDVAVNKMIRNKNPVISQAFIERQAFPDLRLSTTAYGKGMQMRFIFVHRDTFF